MDELYPLFFGNLADGIPSVRQGAAMSLGNVVKAYGILHVCSLVEPPVSDYQKCEDSLITYRRWSLTRIKPQGASSRHIFFMEDNSLHGISKLRHL